MATIVTYGKLGSGQDQKQKSFPERPDAEKFMKDMEKAGYTVSISKESIREQIESGISSKEILIKITEETESDLII